MNPFHNQGQRYREASVRELCPTAPKSKQATAVEGSGMVWQEFSRTIIPFSLKQSLAILANNFLRRLNVVGSAVHLVYLSCRAGLGRFRPGGVFAKSSCPWLHVALHFLLGEVLAVGTTFVGCGGCGPVSLVVRQFVLPDQPVANGIQRTCMDCWTFALEFLHCLLLKGQDLTLLERECSTSPGASDGDDTS